MHGRNVPSFFPTKKKPAPVADEEGLMIPAASDSERYFSMDSLSGRDREKMRASRGCCSWFQFDGTGVWSVRWQVCGPRLTKKPPWGPGTPPEPSPGSEPTLSEEQQPGSAPSGDTSSNMRCPALESRASPNQSRGDALPSMDAWGLPVNGGCRWWIVRSLPDGYRRSAFVMVSWLWWFARDVDY